MKMRWLWRLSARVFELLNSIGIEVRYRDVLVGEYVADLLVEDCVIVEIKAVKSFEDIRTAQCLNYLKATGLQVCLLVNFGSSKAMIKRIVHGFYEDRGTNLASFIGVFRRPSAANGFDFAL
jgi:GxxExxY protein